MGWGLTASVVKIPHMTITLQIYKLLAHISADPASSAQNIYALLARLLNAPAPNNSCTLPGTVGDVIRAIATELDLPCSPIDSTGNLGITLGDPAAPLDLLVTAHMDRPCFRVLNLNDTTLYPLCAIRVPADGYSCPGIALRYEDGRVAIAARGQLHFQPNDDRQRITFAAESGTLCNGATPS